jgi:hypothetical protein
MKVCSISALTLRASRLTSLENEAVSVLAMEATAAGEASSPAILLAIPLAVARLSDIEDRSSARRAVAAGAHVRFGQTPMGTCHKAWNLPRGRRPREARL